MFVILDSQKHNGVREKGETKIEQTLAAASNAAALYWRQFTVNFLIRLYSINVQLYSVNPTSPNPISA